jgi:hypothetical protein
LDKGRLGNRGLSIGKCLGPFACILGGGGGPAWRGNPHLKLQLLTKVLLEAGRYPMHNGLLGKGIQRNTEQKLVCTLRVESFKARLLGKLPRQARETKTPGDLWPAGWRQS